jgi:pilus assembly protein CpaF
MAKEFGCNGEFDNLPAVYDTCIPLKSYQQKKLYPILQHILDESRREVLSLLDKGAQLTSSDYEEAVNHCANRFGFDLTSHERDEVLSFLERENHLFGILQPLIEDPSISDIIVKSYNTITVQKGRRNIRTHLSFPSQKAYENFVDRLLYRAHTSYSTKDPIADGMIDSFARISAIHSSICEEGPYLTIRLNRFESISLDALVHHELAPKSILDYLKHLVRFGKTVLIVGEVGTGKTTLARALASEIPKDESILIIEDTPEIYIDHPHVRALRTRKSNFEETGKISPGACIRAGMRMAMNRIIFGEIRDAEAAESFIDVCASGHPGVSTLHGKSVSDALTRLELFLTRVQPGVEREMLSEQIVTAVQLVVHVELCKVTGKRRVMEVREIGPVSEKVIRSRIMFKYELLQGKPLWKMKTRVSAFKEILDQYIPLATLSENVTL